MGGLDDNGNWLPQMLGGVQFKAQRWRRCGWGAPFTRDAAEVATDVRNEISTREAAERDYGVVLTDDLSVDEAATRAARSGR